MFCEKCGHKINSNKFCSNCGQEVYYSEENKDSVDLPVQEKWYLRLAKVIYVISYVPLPVIIYAVWDSNAQYSYYSSYTKEWTTYGSDSEAFWYSLLTLVIYLIILRLIKIAVLYVVLGHKPAWRTEFKNLF